MNRTFTPPLGPAVLERLEAYAERFRPHFNHPRQALWGEVYLRGLIQEGERKSIEPLSRRVSRPAELASVVDPEQALQQFVSQTHLKHQEIPSAWARGSYKSAKTLWHYTSGSSAVTKARYAVVAAGIVDAQGHK